MSAGKVLILVLLPSFTSLEVVWGMRTDIEIPFMIHAGEYIW